MKSLYRLLAALLAACFITVAAFAADVSPAGTWKWIIDGPTGKNPTTLKLEAKDGKLTGAYSNKNGDAEIFNASFKDHVLAFEVERNYGGGKIVLQYRGKLDGDTIKGTIDAAGGSLDWNAKRGADEPAKK